MCQVPPNVSSTPKDFVRLRDNAKIMNHRPFSNHGVPVPLMHEAFGEFVDLFNTCVPTDSDCTLAIELCKAASEVRSAALRLSASMFLADAAY